MKTVDYDALAASSPVNAQAARDMSARDTEGRDVEPDRLELWATKKDPAKYSAMYAKFRDLTGLVKGRLTVIGMVEGGNTAGARWMVRCVCGRYETRRTKALRPTNQNDRCTECDKLSRLQKGIGPKPDS
jgi:hypothetical protein